MNSLPTVHLRVNDARTGQPTPARLHISGPAGEYYAPFGRLVDFPTARNEDVGGNLYLGGKKFAYIDGSCEIPLPTEVPLSIEIRKGPAYVPIRQTLALGKGQMALRFTIEPHSEPEWQVFDSCDARAHFLTPHAARLEAEAEGLNWVNLLATVCHDPSTDGHLYRTIPNVMAFSGQEPVLPGVVVNTFNTHPVLGKLALLNCHRPVFPLTFGGDDSDDWSLGDWCGQCHRKNGLVVWSEAFRTDGGLSGGEGLIGVILGEVDAIEFDGRERTPPLLPWWYRLLNAGFYIPIVGAGGKDSNRVALGAMRTYTPKAQSYGQWVEHAREGRTVVSNGPLIQLQLDRERGRVSAWAVAPGGFDQLEIVVNGQVRATAAMNSLMRSEVVLESLPVEGGWVAARCHGAGKSELYAAPTIFAHTSALELPSASGRYRQRKAFPALKHCVEETQSWIETQGRFQNSKSKQQLMDRSERAMKVLLERETESRPAAEGGS